MTDAARVLGGALVVGSTLFGALGVIAAPAPSDGEVEEVLRVVRAFNDAFEANDADRYFDFIDEDIVVLTPANPYRVEGLEHDRAEFEWGLETGRTRIGYFQELQPLVRVHGKVAVVTYYSRGSYGPDEAVAYLKETDVLVRREDGWKITHIHVSATTR